MGMDKCNELLGGLVACRANVVRRGSVAIRMALSFAKSLGCSKLYIPDMGGWVTYEKDGAKLGFSVEKFVTEDGRFDSNLVSSLEPDSVLLVHSLAGYYYGLPMKDIYDACVSKNIFLINDCSGSIGSDIAKYGDVILGSFSKWKPINLGEGGFVASCLDGFWSYILGEKWNGFLSPDLEFDLLMKKISNLDARRSVLINKCTEVAESLKMHDPIIDSGRSIVVIVPFSSNDEKEALIMYCNDSDLSYTICPRYIRIMRDAVSIEIKRLE